MTYVKNAPGCLIEFYEVVTGDPNAFAGDGIDLDLVRRLLTYEEVDEAWKELTKDKYSKPKRDKFRISTSDSDSSSDDDIDCSETPEGGVVMDVYYAAERALHNPDWTWRRSELRDYFENIARAAREFSEAVKHSPFNYDIYRFFPVPTLVELMCHFQEHIREYGAKEMAKETLRSGDVATVTEKYLGRDTTYFREDGRDTQFRSTDGDRFPENDYVRLSGFSEDAVRRLFIKSFPYGMPRMSVLAEALADAAEKEAHLAMNDPSFIIPRPGWSSAKRTYVIRYLAMWFKHWFGEYLTGTLARIASVTLDDPEIGPGHVDEATRHWKPPEKPWNRSPYERPL